VPALERAGAHCTLQTPPALAALLARSFPNARVVPLGHCPADVELRIPVMSLPLAMQTFSEFAVLAAVPYLVPDGQKAANWASRLTTHPAPTVGLVWRGLNTHQNDQNRSLALDALTPLLDRSHTRFVALQKDLTPSESERLARHDNVIVLDHALDSFDDTAAVISTLDLVISVDSAPAHLSGAQGTPVWILLPFNADWRWMVARDDSPWYPTAKLFRQASVGDWAEVIARVGDALDGRATGRPVDNQQMAGLMHSTLTPRSEE
jgi:hypothetical protein